MNSKQFRKILGWCVLVFFILACSSPLAARSAPTATPLPMARIEETLNVAIAGTSAAAQTQTETMRPPTFTPTFTPTPSRTPTVTFTPTPTFIYSLFTSTLQPEIAEANLTAASNPVVDLGDGFVLTPIPLDRQNALNQWRCNVRYSPHPVVAPGQKFYASWTVANIGWAPWTSNTIDFVYRGGVRGGRLNIQDIPSTVGYGKTLTIGAYFTAPKRIGEHKSGYVLRVDATHRTDLCALRMIIKVE